MWKAVPPTPDWSTSKRSRRRREWGLPKYEKPLGAYCAVLKSFIRVFAFIVIHTRFNFVKIRNFSIVPIVDSRHHRIGFWTQNIGITHYKIFGGTGI